MKDRTLTRRRLVAMLGLGGAGAVLAACSAAATPTQPPAKPAEAPKPAEAAKPAEAPKPAAGAQYTPGKPAGGSVVWLVRSTPQETKGQEAIFEPAIKQALPNLQV